MRREIMQYVVELLRDTNAFKNIYAKQTDWDSESEFPIAYVLFPAQAFQANAINKQTLSGLRGQGILTIRIVVENTDDQPEYELDTLLDTVFLALLQDTTLGGNARTTDIRQVLTDGGVLVTHSIGDISLEVQI